MLTRVIQPWQEILKSSVWLLTSCTPMRRSVSPLTTRAQYLILGAENCFKRPMYVEEYNEMDIPWAYVHFGAISFDRAHHGKGTISKTALINSCLAVYLSMRLKFLAA